MVCQAAGSAFITAWSAAIASLICILISHIADLSTQIDDLEIGYNALPGGVDR